MTASAFQAGAVKQGRAYERIIVSNLEASGWTIVNHGWVEPITRVQVDIVAIDRNGDVWWIECKGSWESASARNGLLRTDTTKKAIGSAALLSTLEERAKIMVVTSNEPAGDTTSGRWLAIAVERGWIDRIMSVPVL